MNKIFTILLITLSLSAFSQTGTLSGQVLSSEGPVPYARVHLLNTQKGTIADSLGVFNLKNISPGEYKVRISGIGYMPVQKTVDVEGDKILSMDFNLEVDNLQLNQVVVTGKLRETMILNSPVKIEVINRSFFKSNPVNNIIEALELVNGVQEQVNCGVCGTNDIHINGMEGAYTLVMIDGMPIVSGLSSVYGFNGIPTSLIERVEIVKGPSSTLYGTEAVGGVINIITRSSHTAPVVDFETRYSTHHELNTSLALSPKIGKRVFTTFSADFYRNQWRMDFNGDGFTDVPLNNRISAFNKWEFLDKKGYKLFSLAGRYYSEDRFGGLMHWTHADRGSSTVYGENIKTERVEIIGSYIFPGTKRSLKLDFSANHHHQDSYYGDVSYNAIQNVFFSNLTWNKMLGKRNDFLVGLTGRYNYYRDNTPSLTDENSVVPGIFVQDEIKITDQLTVLGGARLDYHQNHGLIFSPRINIKKDFGVQTSLRANYGTGFRQVHLFTEDHAFVTGSRDVVILNELQPERSHNWTLNFNHTYKGLGVGNFDIDVFYTYFQNKIVPDYDQDPNLIVYDNLDGYGTSRGVSASIQHAFPFGLQVKTGATFMDVFEMAENDQGDIVKEEQFFAPRFSGTFGLTYEMKKIGLSLNYTGRVMGDQRLPTYDDPFTRPDRSDWFTVQNVQLTKTFKKANLEIYTGVKNLFNYTQPTPLVDPANPFGDAFDTAYAYGPLQVRRFYFGLRWSLERKLKNISVE